MNQVNPLSTYSTPRIRTSALKKLTAVILVPLIVIAVLAMLFSTLWVTPSSAAAPEAAVTATVLYVTENGNIGSSCSIADPCSLDRALVLAVDGDEIRMAKGTYTSNSAPILLLSQSITVSGGFNESDWNTADPVVNLTILDAEENGRVVQIDGANNNNSVIIQGLAIRNGLTAGGGGGIYIENGATAIIRNNRIHNNRANSTTFGGGGIYADGDVTIQNNHIYDNTSTNGGGIRIGTGGATTTNGHIAYNQIYSNTATLDSIGHGGGIFIANNSIGFIDGNTIYNNTARDGGGMAAYFNAVTTIQNNIFYQNVATLATTNEGGGGIMLRVATATMWNNTVAYNNSGQNGGGIFLNFSTAEMSNNTVVSNTTTNNSNSNTGIYDLSSTINGGYNNTFGNTDNTGLSPSYPNQDPLFTNNGTPNLRLSSGSPDRDRGDTTLITVTTDIDQQARPNNGIPDIGADEFYATTPLYDLTPIVSEDYVSRDVGSATFNHQIENIGTQTDSYSFECSNSQGWTITTCPSDVTNLTPGAISALQTSINVPSNATPLDAGTTFITATATNSPDVTVAAVHTIVAPRPGISFTQNITALLLPGEVFIMPHILTNLSDAQDSFLIELTGDTLNWATLLPSNPTVVEDLFPNESRTVYTSIRVNNTAAAGISDIITIKASSEFSPSVSATVVNTITAKPTVGNRYVNTSGNDTNNNCTQNSSPCKTVAWAVSQARAGDTVFVAAGTYTEVSMNLNGQIQIRGQGATPADVTIQGSGATRLFNVAAGLTAQPTITNLTLRNGNGADGGAVFVDTAAYIKFVSVIFDANTAANGGAIYANNNAVVTLESCTFTNNSSTADGGAMYLNGSTVYMKNSRFETNTAVSNGGAIYANGAALNGENNLIASNTTDGDGGGIYAAGGSMALQFTTITNNSGDTGGGIYANSTTISIEDTAIVSNTATVDHSSIRTGVAPLNFQYNAIWPTNSADFTLDGTNLVLSANPSFDGADYQVLAGNELVDFDTRSSNLVDVETDFEGDFRPSDQGYDLGWDELAGCRAKRGANIYGNIQEAVLYTDAISPTTNFIQVTGICRGANNPNHATVSMKSSDGISSTLVIEGGWNGDFSERTYETTIIDPEGEGRAFYIRGITTTIELLTIVNGDALNLGEGGDGAIDAGGAIYVHSGMVTLNNIDIQDSSAEYGGAIYNNTGSLLITSFEPPVNFNPEEELNRSTISIISNNAASIYGGGVYNANGLMTVNRAIIRGNTAVNHGGGVYLSNGLEAENTLLNLVLADNAATNNGGGLYVNTLSELWHMTVYSNTATNGGGIYNAAGNSIIKNSIFQDNQATTGEAINVDSGVPAIDYNYYFNNDLSGTTGGSNSRVGAIPAGMLNPDGGNYHLTDISPVLDRGVPPDIMITTDFDGKIRPSNQGYDIGADELLGCLARTDDVIYGNIQLALIAAVDGAVIDVAGRCSGIHSYDTGGPLGIISQTVHITKNTHLVGGWDLDFIEQNSVTTIDAGALGRAIYIAPAVEATIENFEILLGDASGMDGNGGAIYIDQAADVNIINNHIYSNTAVNGAAVYSVDSVTTLDKGNRFYDNEATNGAVYLTHADGFTATVQNNYFYHNNATDGAAVYSAAGDNILRHNTVYSNTATNDGGGFYILADAPDVRSNIFMNNTAVNDGGGISGVATAVVDYNNYFNNSPNATGGNISSGTHALSSDPAFNNAAIADFSVNFTSPMVDSGDATVDLLHDAANTIRPSHNGMDIGAYEVGGCYARDILAPTVIYGSVQKAIDMAQAASTVEINGTCLGVQDIANSGSTFVTQTLYISKTLTIDGDNWEYDENNPTGRAIFDPMGRGRALYIDSSLITLTVQNIEFRNGNGASAGMIDGGGALYNAGTVITLTNVTMNHSSAARGGAVYNAGELLLDTDTFAYNAATSGGAIYNASDGLMLISSTLYTNTAVNGGGVYNDISVTMATFTATVKNNTFYSYTVPNNGGAIYQANGRFLIDGNTIRNSSADNGGAIYLTGGNSNAVNVWNNIIYDSVATSGGAIYDNNTDSTIWYNTLYQNNVTDGFGAGIRSASTSSSIYNNIVDGGPSGSDGSAIAIDGTPTVGYNLIRGYLSPYTPSNLTPTGDIYDLSPTYVNASENDYHLQYGSVGMDVGLGLPTITTQHDIDDDARPVNSGVDIGADEINTCHLLVDDQLFYVLQEAIDYAEINGFGDIRMARGVCSGVQSKNGTLQVGYISQNITFTGSLLPETFIAPSPTDYDNGEIRAVSSRIDARNEGRAIVVAPNATVRFIHTAFVNGDATQANDANNGSVGGGIYASSLSTVTLQESPLCQNTATNGGGIYADTNSYAELTGGNTGACRVFLHMSDGLGTPHAVYATFAGNEATAAGGGVHMAGDFLINNHLFYGNTAGNGGGMYVSGNGRVINAIYQSNVATGDGGALYNSGTTEVYHNTIRENIANGSGGGIKNVSTININSSIIYANVSGTDGNNGGINGVSAGNLNYNLYYTNVPTQTTRGAAAKVDDPLFLFGSSSLSIDSPAIDQADASLVNTNPFNDPYINYDISQIPRPDGDPNHLGIVRSDIGATEYFKDFGCQITPDDPDRLGVAGQTTIYNFNVTNTGWELPPSQYNHGYTDTITVTLASSSAGWSSLEGGSPLVFHNMYWGESQAFTLTVDVPNQLTGIDITSVTCTPASRPTRIHSSNATTSIGPDRRVEIGIQQIASLKPSEVVTFTHTITNIGNIEDTYELTAKAGGQTGSIFVDTAGNALPTSITMTLSPGQTTSRILQITALPNATAGIVDTPGATVNSIEVTDPQDVQDGVIDFITILPVPGTRYVSAIGGDDNSNCTDAGSPCATIQWAIDQAMDNDAILVAAGDYSTAVTATVASQTITQTLFINKSLTIIGGYSLDDSFGDQHTISNTVTLGGENSRPVVYITNGHDVMLGGLFIQDGYSTSNGGGIYNDGSNLVITSTVLISNSSDIDGGGLYHTNGSLTLQSVVVANNSTGNNGAGLYVAASTGGDLENNTFANNSATGDGGAGYIAGGTFSFQNNIIDGNTATTNSGVHTAGGTLTPNEFNLYNNNSPSVSVTGSNFNADPVFIDDYYHISPASPAKDAGTQAVTHLLGVDIDGEWRKQGNNIDIGADEVTQAPSFDFAPELLTATLPTGGDSHTYTHILTNSSSFTDGYTFSWSGSDPLPAGSSWISKVTTLPVDTSSITSGGTVIVTVIITGTGDGHQFTLDLTATSIADNAVSHAVQNITTIEQATPGVDIGLSSTAIGTANSSVTFNHTITNTGSGANAYTLSQLPPTGWTTVIMPSENIWLEAGDTAPFTVTIQIPVSAVFGQQYTADIEANAVNDLTVSDQLSDTVTVSDGSAGISIAPTFRAQTIQPGETAVYTHTVTNESSTMPENITLSYSTPTETGWSVTIEPQSAFHLAPSDSRLITVTVTSPPDASNVTIDTSITALGDSGETAGAIDRTTTAVPNAGISLIPPARSGQIVPDVMRVYTHTLTNWENGTATIDLSYSQQPPTFTVDVSPASVMLETGESQEITVQITAPLGTQVGITHVVNITATSSISAAVATAVDTSLVSFDIALTPAEQLKIAPAGTVLTFTHTFTNVNGASENFNVTASSLSGWLTDYNPSTFLLGNGASTSVVVTMTIPSGTPVGIEDATTLIVAWQDNAVLSETAVDRARTSQTHGFSFTQSETQNAVPNSIITYTHTLRNSGDGPDNFEITAVSSNNWTVAPIAPIIDLASGASIDVDVILTVPSVTLGTVDIMTVTAVSSIDQTPTPISLIDTTTITNSTGGSGTVYLPVIMNNYRAPVTGLTITPETNAQTVQEGTTAVYTHTVTNDGNSSENVIMSFTDNQSWTTSVLPITFTLAADASAVVTVTVDVPASTGGQVDVATVTATGSSGKTAVATDTTTSSSVPVTPTTTPPPTTPPPPACIFTPPTTGNPAGVDLLVTNVTLSPANPTTGQQVVVNVTIKNQGQADMQYDNGFFLDFYVNPDPQPPIENQIGVRAWGIQSTDFPAGASKTYSVIYTFDATGDMRIWAQVDTDNTVVEANEDNNLYGCKTVTVTGAAINAETTPAPRPNTNAPRVTPTPFSPMMTPEQTVTTEPIWLITTTPLPALPPQSTD